MTTRCSYPIKELKAELNTRMNEYQMLTNSLIEMFEHKSNKESIKRMEDAINETSENIKTLKDCINKRLNETKEEEKKSVYDEIKKPVLPRSFKKTSSCSNNLYNNIKKQSTTDSKCSFFDSIKKEDKPKYGESLYYSEEYKTCDSPHNHSNLNDIEMKVINSNMFLVRFGSPLNIFEWAVKDVCFHSISSKQLNIRIHDYLVTREDGSTYPLISELCARRNDGTSNFTISIDYLDATGHIIYTERYHGCRINDVIREPLSYSSDNFNVIELVISFQEITYETAN